MNLSDFLKRAYSSGEDICGIEPYAITSSSGNGIGLKFRIYYSMEIGYAAICWLCH